MPEEPDERLDLTGVAREHRAPGAEGPRWLRAAVLGTGTALLVAAVLLRHRAGAASWGCVMAPQGVQLLARSRPVLVRIDEEALRVRRGLRLRLPGLPREDTEHLAAALERSRPDPPEGFDGEGPFRRGAGR